MNSVDHTKTQFTADIQKPSSNHMMTKRSFNDDEIQKPILRPDSQMPYIQKPLTISCPNLHLVMMNSVAHNENRFTAAIEKPPTI